MSPHSSVMVNAASEIGGHSLIPVWSSAAEIQSVARSGRFVCGSSESCDVRIQLNGVAANHCLVDSSNDFITVSPASGAGLWLNDVPVVRAERVHSGDILAIGPATFRFQAGKPNPAVSAALAMQEQQASSSNSNIAEHIARLERRLEAAEASHLEAVLPLVSALAKQSQTKLNLAEASTDTAAAGSGAESIATPSDDESDHELADENSRRLHNLELKLHRQTQDLEACTRQLEAQEIRLQHEQTEFEQGVAEFEQRVAEATVEAAAEQRADLEQWKVELTGQQQALAQRSSEMDARQNELTLQAEQLANAADDVATQAENLESDRRALLETERQQHRKAESAHSRVAEMENAIAEREAQLATRETAVTDAGQDASQQQTDLESSLERIATLESELAERDSQLADQQNHAATARQSESERQAEVEASRERIENLESELAERDTQLADQQNHAATARQGESERQAEVEASRERIEKLESELAERDTQLAAHESEISEAIENERQRQTEDLESREAEVKERAAAVEKAAHDLEQQGERLRDREATVDSNNTLREQEVEEREQQLTTRETSLAADESVLEERQRQVAAQEQYLRERDIERADEADKDREQARAHDELSSAEVELLSRADELATWESELDARHKETAERVAQLKQLSRANAAAHLPGTDSAAAGEELVAGLKEAQERSDVLAAERDELSTALTELRSAFQAVRDELTARQEAEAEEEASSDADRQQLQQLVTDRSDELHQLQTQLSDSHKDVETLQQQLQEVVGKFDVERAAWHDAASSTTTMADDNDDTQATLSEYEAIIGQLRDELEHARNSSAAKDSDELQDADTESADIEELRREIAEKDELLLEFQAHLGESTEAQADAEQIRLQHAELDDRIAVLDQREADIRERQRGVENTEEDIEDQQRQLLEARQRLELARAEIQIAADSPPQPSQDVPPDQSDEESIATDTTNTDATDAENDEDQTSLRSELAEMFGLGSDEAAESFAVEVPTSIPTPIDDYSQEGSEAVSLSFDSSDGVLLESQTAADTPADDEHASADEFVADYMEQLLARNRQKAGSALPEELVQASVSSTQPAPPAAAPQAAPSASADSSAAPPEPQVPGTRSFIDAYMAGDFDSHTPEAPLEVPQVGEVAPSTDDQTADTERPKVDLDALRSDMNSFRALSTQSVENALAVHAKRIEQSGITTRSTIFLVLAVICGFMVLAVLMNVIPAGLFVWLSVGAAVVSGIDLFAKIYSVNKKVKQTAGSLERRANSAATQSAVPEQVISPEFLETPPPSADEESDGADPASSVAPDQPLAPTVNGPKAEDLDDVEELEEFEEEDEYFEL